MINKRPYVTPDADGSAPTRAALKLLQQQILSDRNLNVWQKKYKLDELDLQYPELKKFTSVAQPKFSSAAFKPDLGGEAVKPSNLKASSPPSKPKLADPNAHNAFTSVRPDLGGEAVLTPARPAYKSAGDSAATAKPAEQVKAASSFQPSQDTQYLDQLHRKFQQEGAPDYVIGQVKSALETKKLADTVKQLKALNAPYEVIATGERMLVDMQRGYVTPSPESVIPIPGPTLPPSLQSAAGIPAGPAQPLPIYSEENPYVDNEKEETKVFDSAEDAEDYLTYGVAPKPEKKRSLYGTPQEAYNTLDYMRSTGVPEEVIETVYDHYYQTVSPIYDDYLKDVEAVLGFNWGDEQYKQDVLKALNDKYQIGPDGLPNIFGINPKTGYYNVSGYDLKGPNEIVLKNIIHNGLSGQQAINAFALSMRRQGKITADDIVKLGIAENEEGAKTWAILLNLGYRLAVNDNKTFAEAEATFRDTNEQNLYNVLFMKGTGGIPGGLLGGELATSGATTKGKIGLLDGMDVIDGKVGGKIPINEYKAIRKASIFNPKAKTVTLGKFYPTVENGVEIWSKPGPDSYIVRAGKDSSYFNLGQEWRKIQKKYNLSDQEMFTFFNAPAIYDAIANGKVIRFSHDPREFDKGYIVDEWEYIKKLLKITDVDLKEIGGFWYVQRLAN